LKISALTGANPSYAFSSTIQRISNKFIQKDRDQAVTGLRTFDSTKIPVCEPEIQDCFLHGFTSHLHIFYALHHDYTDYGQLHTE